MKFRTLISAVLCLGLAAAAAAVGDLRSEYRVDPQGMDCLKPRLSWVIGSNRRGELQTAYQVLVASTPERLARDEGDLWDSGKVASDQSNQIEYAGKPLASRQRCSWRVRVWDKDQAPSAWSQPAAWSMGLLKDDDWRAAWIGVEPAAAKPPPAAGLLAIRTARYQAVDGAGSADVAARLAALIKDGRLAARVDNETMGGDPADGHKKRLHIAYDLDGKLQERDIEEGGRLAIPDDGGSATSQPPVPRYLRKPFAVNQPIRRATAYVTALGLYELRINGARVGNHLLAPEWTNYHKRVQYQACDVTGLLRQGPNAIGAILGNGWYCGRWQKWKRELAPIYGDQPYFKMQLEIEAADGSTQVVASDASWRGTVDGPLRLSGIFEGETYDARQEMPGWDAAGFDDQAWRAVSVAAPKAGPLVWQRSEPIQVSQEIVPVSVSEPKPGVYVFDLGQNIAGWCRLKLRADAGTTLTLLHNEVLNKDGTVYMDNLHAGHLSQGDRQIVRYTCRGGGEEIYEPRFTYMGFRYVEVRGLTAKPPADLLTARVFHTGFRPTGSFTCSSDLLNRLVLNIQWSQRANMMGIPTDCCQRDERCGYTGDMNFFMPAAIYNFDVAAFFNKWLVDVCQDAQLPDGHFADHAPTFGPGDGYNTGWSDAGIICPYRIWRTYGDTRVIRDHYAAMQRKLAFIETKLKDSLHTGRIGNGDWLNLGGGAAKEVIGTAYDAYDFRLMAEMAEAIGETQDAAAYRNRSGQIAAAFLKAYVDQEGRIKESSQTGYALAFTMGLVPEDLRQKMGDGFVAEVKRFKDHLATGFIGTPRLLPGLHLAGRDDVAYRILFQEDFPSWIYQVKNGATTMWERWDGIRPNGTFADSGMNSFNHYSFGAVGEYLFGTVGGIGEAAPGYRRLRIAPVPGPGLDWVKASYDSINGKITTAWKLEAGKFELEVTIPANTTATAHVPAKDQAAVTESGKPAATAEGVKFLRMENGAAIFTVGSGHYRFQADR